MLEQVVMNLAVMPVMPCLRRDAHHHIEPVRVDEEQVKGNLNARPGHSLSVGRDTGCGMDETTLKRIYEPFFTPRK